MDHPQESPRVLSTCTGYGGLELGVAAALGRPLRVVAYVEREAFACANLVAQIEAGRLPCAPIWTDLRSFDARPLRGCIDLLTGGYPCQPFSLAGSRLGEADPRHLWPCLRRIISECRPEWCFFENVRGHVSLGLRDVRCDLEGLGYRVEAGLFSAEEVGAPHRRERVYILAANTNRELVRLQSVPRPGSEGPTFARDDGAAQSLADPDSLRERQSEGGQPHLGGWLGNGGPPLLAVADPNRPGLEIGECEPGDDAAQLPAASESGRTWPAEPDVGRVVDGCPNRVDRLRLLGNGVVPACAEHAFRTLYERHLTCV